jgi:hypothetical protein
MCKVGKNTVGTVDQRSHEFDIFVRTEDVVNGFREILDFAFAWISQ